MRTLLSIRAFFSVSLLVVMAVLAAPSAAQHPREGLLVLVDHAATSAEVAERCERRVAGSGPAIREAYARWHAQHHAAHTQLIDALLEQVQAGTATRGNTTDTRQVLDQFRVASMGKLRQSMDAKDSAALEQFCTSFPAEFDKPEMDFTSMWLRRQSRR